ncbi:hypothetical protein EDD79_10901, partial [Serpentinicella alkaliphila]
IENNLERKMYNDFPYVFIIQGDNMKYYTIGQFSKLVGKSIQTITLNDS